MNEASFSNNTNNNTIQQQHQKARCEGRFAKPTKPSTPTTPTTPAQPLRLHCRARTGPVDIAPICAIPTTRHLDAATGDFCSCVCVAGIDASDARDKRQRYIAERQASTRCFRRTRVARDCKPSVRDSKRVACESKRVAEAQNASPPCLQTWIEESVEHLS
jgi:hypothetical protein